MDNPAVKLPHVHGRVIVVLALSLLSARAMRNDHLTIADQSGRVNDACADLRALR
jgi:hypothetical protein